MLQSYHAMTGDGGACVAGVMEEYIEMDVVEWLLYRQVGKLYVLCHS